MSCTCNAGCATKRCPCKQSGHSCTMYCHPSKLCANKAPKREKEVYVDLTGVKDSPASTKVSSMWIDTDGITLHDTDKKILQNSKVWLTDLIIDAAQCLLKKVCIIPGFQSVSLGQTLTFSVQTGQFIQILNTGTSHWVTITCTSSKPPVIQVYDSLYSSASSVLQEQIAAIVFTDHPAINLEFMNVPLQSGASDCGLYAIAYATTLALGKKPELYKYDQSQMRSHLLTCLEKKELTVFPTVRMQRRKQKVIKAIQVVKVFCSCRMTQMKKAMVQCTKCAEWYHLSCHKDIPKEAIDSHNIPWYCHCCL